MMCDALFVFLCEISGPGEHGGGGLPAECTLVVTAVASLELPRKFSVDEVKPEQALRFFLFLPTSCNYIILRFGYDNYTRSLMLRLRCHTETTGCHDSVDICQSQAECDTRTLKHHHETS